MLAHGEPPHEALEAAVLGKCANPECPATFRNFRDGRVFVTEVEADYQTGVSGHARQSQYFWLCSSCCRTMAVTARNEGPFKLFGCLCKRLQLGQRPEISF